MLRADWQDAIRFSEWKPPLDDKHILVATAYIILHDPVALKNYKLKKNRRELEQHYMRGFYHNVVVPADAGDKQKEQALKRAKVALSNDFDRLLTAQGVFEVTENTEPLKPKQAEALMNKV